MTKTIKQHLLLLVILIIQFNLVNAQDKSQFIVFKGDEGPGKGKHIVFISGDEEYRSEEGLPMLAKILAQKHGFKCTVLFAIDSATNIINPENNTTD